jgi:uncharacterized membrane protein
MNPLHRWQRHLRSRPRLITAALITFGLFLAALPLMSISRAILVSFDLGITIFLVLIANVMSRATPITMRQRAMLQDEGKWVVLGASMIVSAVVMLALYLELHAGKDKSLRDALISGVTICLSWLFLAAIFAQQYAHSFYLDPECKDGGLLFPGTTEPDYWDFMYFSVVLNMTFQVSDVQITARSIRRLALLHGIVAFFFNVTIIALTVNVVAGIL